MSEVSVSTELLALHLSIASLDASPSSSPLLSSTGAGSLGAPVLLLILFVVDSLSLLVAVGVGNGMFSGSLHTGLVPHVDRPRQNRKLKTRLGPSPSYTQASFALIFKRRNNGPH